MEDQVNATGVGEDDAMIVPVDVEERTFSEGSNADTDSARLLSDIESDQDPFSLAEATAAIAGEAGGDDDGGNFVRVSRIDESTSADASLDQIGRGRVASAADGDLTRFSSQVTPPPPAHQRQLSSAH